VWRFAIRLAPRQPDTGYKRPKANRVSALTNGWNRRYPVVAVRQAQVAAPPRMRPADEGGSTRDRRVAERVEGTATNSATRCTASIAVNAASRKLMM